MDLDARAGPVCWKSRLGAIALPCAYDAGASGVGVLRRNSDQRHGGGRHANHLDDPGARALAL